jgi:C-terminal processing protease CtpA/Prc/mannose-6-phosphate isomerase-like protein (cupin superfamily)
LDDLDFNEEIYIHAANNSSKPVNISMHPKGDFNPVWSKDGSKLGFLSSRNNGDTDVWFAWLNKSDWEKTKQDWDEAESDDDGDKKKESKTVNQVKIDFKDIHYRLSQVTALPGNESNLAVSHDGENFFFVSNGNGRQVYKAERDLYKIKWDGTKSKPITSGGTSPNGVDIGPKGKKIYFAKRGGKISSVIIDKSKVENLPFSAKMDINYPEERKQVFAEAWRALNAGFYDPKFHGQDFTNLKVKYHDWAISASTQTDFYNVFNLMIGQINASHMGLRGSDMQKTQRERTGLLGIDISPESNGIKVSRVIPNSAADRANSKLFVGDIITSVDGKSVSSGKNFYAQLSNKSNEKVILEVYDMTGKTREVIIRPSSSLSTLLYDEWVVERRRLTDEYSNGELGYIHIRGMNWTSFEQFERELMASGNGKKGLVIDVRYNGGGWTTDYLMAVLNVRQHAFTIPRGAAEDLALESQNFTSHYPYGERLPLSSWTKPAIAICNSNSYSNAEIFSYAFKTLNRGTLVGTPTFGAVISTGGQGLIDGSFVRLPFRAWYVLATGKSMENLPAIPDIILDNAPDSKFKGVDEQLKKAVDTVLEEIK